MDTGKRSPVGIIRVPISQLTLDPPSHPGLSHYRRKSLFALDLKRARRLASILQAHGAGAGGSTDPIHQISGLVSEKTFRIILQSAQLSQEELRETNRRQSYPSVRGNFKIWCFRGRRRILAALIAFGRNYQLTVRLYCKTEGSTLGTNFRRFIRDENESFLHEAGYSDGEIYWNVREYRNDPIQAQKWKLRLSKPKQKHLASLLGRIRIVGALDRLRSYPGLWAGLKLGNIHRHLATHCDESIIRNFNHTADIWEIIADNDDGIKQATDIETVQFLQFRAPSASASDRVLISRGMESGTLFRYVGDSRAREGLKRRLLALTCIIPSIATFDTNMKYIAIGARILSDHIEVRPKPIPGQPVATLYDNLTHQWNAPEQLLVEVREGCFCPLRGTPSPNLAFMLLFLRALRDFPRLCEEKPLQDFRGERTHSSLDQQCVKELCEHAAMLGFSNPKIQNGLQLPSRPTVMNFDVEASAPVSDWRGGKPFWRTYLDLRRTSFIPNLMQTPLHADYLTAAFVQRDIIESFFTVPPIHIAQYDGPSTPLQDTSDTRFSPEPFQPDEAEIPPDGNTGSIPPSSILGPTTETPPDGDGNIDMRIPQRAETRYIQPVATQSENISADKRKRPPRLQRRVLTKMQFKTPTQGSYSHIITERRFRKKSDTKHKTLRRGRIEKSMRRGQRTEVQTLGSSQAEGYQQDIDITLPQRRERRRDGTGEELDRRRKKGKRTKNRKETSRELRAQFMKKRRQAKYENAEVRYKPKDPEKRLDILAGDLQSDMTPKFSQLPEHQQAEAQRPTPEEGSEEHAGEEQTAQPPRLDVPQWELPQRVIPSREVPRRQLSQPQLLEEPQHPTAEEGSEEQAGREQPAQPRRLEVPQRDVPRREVSQPQELVPPQRLDALQGQRPQRDGRSKEPDKLTKKRERTTQELSDQYIRKRTSQEYDQHTEKRRRLRKEPQQESKKNHQPEEGLTQLVNPLLAILPLPPTEVETAHAFTDAETTHQFMWNHWDDEDNSVPEGDSSSELMIDMPSRGAEREPRSPPKFDREESEEL